MPLRMEDSKKVMQRPVMVKRGLSLLLKRLRRASTVQFSKKDVKIGEIRGEGIVL